METPVEIAFHNMDRPPHVQARVEERVARLEQFFGRLTHCRVVIEAPHHRHRKGNHYEVRIEVQLPAGDIAINRTPGDVNAHEDVLVAVRDAFDAMERRLRRWKEQHTGRPVEHEAMLQGRIAELHADRGFGQIATTDGRLIYFHENSVVGARFADLAEGDVVELVVDAEDAEKGPHASTVRPIGDQRFVDRPA